VKQQEHSAKSLSLDRSQNITIKCCHAVIKRVIVILHATFCLA